MSKTFVVNGVCPIHTTQEKWAVIPLPELENNYWISTRGRIKSSDRTMLKLGRGRKNKYTAHIKGKIIKGSVQPDGYVTVELWRGHRYQVSNLVLATFVGPCPEGMECCHFPHNTKTHNCIENLRWDIPTENNRDKIRAGTITNGEMVNTAVLTAANVQELRNTVSLENGKIPKNILHALTKKHGVCESTIIRAYFRKTWKHVP